jgi:hypothetical protein
MMMTRREALTKLGLVSLLPLVRFLPTEARTGDSSNIFEPPLTLEKMDRIVTKSSRSNCFRGSMAELLEPRLREVYFREYTKIPRV